MNIQSHVNAMQDKRAKIKQAIHNETNRAAPDFALVAKLKKQNLSLKTEIMQISQNAKLAA